MKMGESEYRALQHYIASDQRVRLDTSFFSARQASGIRNGLKQGYWLSAGKIAWLADAVAAEYKLPFIQYSRGAYSSGLHWNATAGKLPGFIDALVALNAYCRMVNDRSKDTDYNRGWKNDQRTKALADPTTCKYMPLEPDASEQVRAQLAKLNVVESDNVNRFLKDWDENNVWLTIS